MFINFYFVYTTDIGKSSNQSPKNFNILARLGNIQKCSLIQAKVFYIHVYAVIAENII